MCVNDSGTGNNYCLEICTATVTGCNETTHSCVPLIDQEAEGHDRLGSPDRKPAPDAVRVAPVVKAEGFQPRVHRPGDQRPQAFRQSRRFGDHQFHCGRQKGHADQGREEGAQEVGPFPDRGGNPVQGGNDLKMPVVPGGGDGSEKGDPKGKVSQVVGGVGDAEP